MKFDHPKVPFCLVVGEGNHKIGDYPSKHFLDSYTTALIGHCNLLGRGELLGNGIARQINDVDPNEDSQLPTATNKPRRMPPRTA